MSLFDNLHLISVQNCCHFFFLNRITKKKCCKYVATKINMKYLIQTKHDPTKLLNQQLLQIRLKHVVYV